LNLQSPSARVDSLEGYTDGVSSERTDEDRELRRSRANAVAQELIHLGALPANIGEVHDAPAQHYLTGDDSPDRRTVNPACLLRISPISGRPLPPIPHPHPVPPRVYRYKIRLTFGLSLFITDGLSLDILDMTTRQVAVYDYRGLNFSRGLIPGSVTLRGPW